MKIITACGMGFGTSLMVKMTIEDILGEMEFSADVEACDVGSIAGRDADLVVTSADMENQLSALETDIIFLRNMADKQEVREKLMAYLDKK